MSSKKVLELQDICYKDILRSVSFTWTQGEILALMGPNGAGKSTLARLIAGLIPPSSGEIRLQQEEVTCPWDRVKRWQEIGFVGQHPRRQTIGATVAEELAFGLINLGLDQQTVQNRVSQLAAQIGLQGKENQSPATLSGGERQRLVTAAILALNPAFLILDEGLSMLDVRAQAKIMELLEHARPETGQLWITHDLELARRADRLLVLDNGKIVDWGNPIDAFNRHRFELSSYERIVSTDSNSSIGLEDSRSAFAAATEFKSPHKQRIEGAASPLSPILEWDQANFDLRLSLDNVIKRGEFLAIVGPSGSGKTTLLESVAGFILPTEGRLLVDGETMEKKKINSLRRKCGFVLQEAGEYLIGRNVMHELFFTDPKQALKTPNEEQAVFMEHYGISTRLAKAAPEHLSGGERQKVALAAAMRNVPEILLMDEPLLGLDSQTKISILATVYALKGITILYVTHDLREVLGAADRIWLIEDGKIVLDCRKEQWKEYQEQFLRSGVRC
ncbi:ABC transporter ATP-binding protein [Desulfosporosinus sp. SB140]|uniref:ABC transporter ATP-binding protein n=1 Tax=Desulfosporosinus paludis TaxID=3115649 RepID=UPI00388F2193